MHGLACECSLGRQNVEVAPLDKGVGVEGSMFVKFSANFEDSDPRESTRYQKGSEPFTDCRCLRLESEGGWATVSRLVLQNINLIVIIAGKDIGRTIFVMQSRKFFAE